MTIKQPIRTVPRPIPPAVVKLLREAAEAHQAGNFVQAEGLYRRVLKLDAKQPQVLLTLGFLQAQRGDYLGAEQHLREALELNPGFARGQFNYGNVLVALERFDDALAAFGKALSLDPTLVEAHLNRGNVLILRKHYEEAVACFDNAIRINPNFAQAHGSRTHALQELGRLTEALASCDRALELNPGSPELHASRATILSHLRHHDDAERSISLALSLRPNNSTFHYNHGNILIEANNYRGAIAAFENAQTHEADFSSAHLNEGLCRLLLGDTERGWEKYEYRLRLPDYIDLKRNFGKPVWSGDRPLQGETILVHSEQGFGDALMACRYVPRVAALGARVVLEIRPELLRLMGGLDGVSMVIARGKPIPQFDVHCPIMSLPRAFKTRLETIPTEIPYLEIPKENVEFWRSKLANGRFKVGIAWAGNSSFKSDRDRSITLKNILPLCSVADATFVSVQKDLRDGDAEILNRNPHIYHLGDGLNDFLDTAAVMESLDLIISSDTSIVHLAGALGKPVWVLLSFNPDWRWLLERTDSPWYPTARLFRQTKAGDWNSIVKQARNELERALGP